MALPEILTTNLQEYLDREEIIQETIRQIEKDFSMFGVEVEFSGNLCDAYLILHRQLVVQVHELLSTNAELLMSILYQIDISGRDLARSRTFFPDYSQTELIAHEIIFRDLKKVLFRRYFRQHPS